jgi:hypothetical protein
MLGLLFFLLAIYFYFSPQRYISVLLLFALVTAGFQLVPLSLMVLPSIGITKSYDWVLLFTGAVILLKPKLFIDTRVWASFKMVLLYGTVLIFLLLYSIYIREVEVSVSIRVFRGLIYFVTLFLFIPLTQTEFQKIFKLIIIFSSLAAVIYCMQLVLHRTLLNKVATDQVGLDDGETINRYYNLPVFIYPVIFFLFFKRNIFSVPYRYVFLFFSCAAVLLSQHRNLLFAIVVCYFLYLLLNQGFKIRNLVFYAIISIGLVLGVNFIWEDRFSQGLEDISQTSFDMSQMRFNEVTLSELSTTEFRQLLLFERLNYILKDNESSLFGIGLITDDSYKAAKLNFNVGLTDGYGNVTQVASGDIVWSVLFLQLGIAGTLAFILFHLSLLVKFFSKRRDSYMQVGCLYVICLVFTSFYSNTIELPYVTTLLMLFAAYYFNLSKNSFTSSTYGS